MRPVTPSIIRTLAALALGLTMLPARGTHAQTGTSTITLDGPCELSGANSGAPEVSCVVSVLDASGVPINNLTAAQFQVSVDNSAAQNVRVTTTVNEARVLNTVLVVDLGATAPGLDEAALKVATRRLIESLPDRDRIALIAITGRIDLGDTNNPPIDPARESGFVQAGPGRNALINIVTALRPPGNTPLYDAVCKALILASKENLGARAVVVISDGRDVRSTGACTSPEDPIQRAIKDKTPIYAIGIGSNLTEDYLRRVTLQTGGRYLDKAADAEGIVSRFKQAQTLLKTQTVVRFTSPVALTGRSHTAIIGVDLPGGRREARTTYALPKGITIKALRARIGDRDVPLRELPADGDVFLEPEIDAPAITRVEYDINGLKLQSDKQPFAVPLPSALPAGVDVPVVVRVVNASITPTQVVTATERLRLRLPPTLALPTPTPPPPPPQPSVPVWAWIAMAVAGLLLLGGGLFLWRRSRAPAPEPAYAAEPLAPIVQRTATDLRDSTSVETNQTMIGRSVDATQVMAGSNSTLVMQAPLARLVVDLPGLREVPVALADRVVIGRDVSGANSVKLPSPYVSRQHAEITRREDALFVTDLGSASGTRLNGQKLTAKEPVRINVGDVIEFANVRAEVRAA